MMKFKDWQVINETYGHYNLGVKSKGSIGTVGGKLAEMGLEADDMTDDLSGLPGVDDGGFGGDSGLDDGGMGGLDAMSSDPDSGKIKLDDLHPSLIHLLGLSMHKGAGANGAGLDKLGGDMDDDSDDGSSNPFGDSGNPFGDSDDDGDDDMDDDSSNPFGDSDDDSDDDSGNPFGDSEDSDGDGESDDEDSDDDNDGADDEEDVAPKDPTKKSKKFMGSKCDDKAAYSKKFMSKKGKPTMEDVDFFNSLATMTLGNTYKKFDAAVPGAKKQSEPKPGEVGYAPQGRINSWPTLEEWSKNNTK